MSLGRFKACVGPGHNPSAVEPNRRRHRHRRFHIRPEALGQDYHRYDVLPGVAPESGSLDPDAAALSVATPELLLDRDFRHQTARSGLWLCVESCLWLLVVAELGWTVRLFLQVTVGWLWPN